MARGTWKDLMVQVLGEVDATSEWDHLLHHVESEFDARLFEEEIRAALEDLESEGKISYSGVQGYEIIDEPTARADGGDKRE